MDEQPVALRLADALEEKEYPPRRAAAAELRRLYQLAQEQHTEIYGLRLKVCNLLDKVLQVIKEMRPAAEAIKDKPASWWLDRIEEAVKQLKEKNHG
jgi:hypothetical protein